MASDKSSGFFTIRRTISLIVLLGMAVAVFLALKKPARPAAQSAAEIAANAESFQAKVNQLAGARDDGQTGSEVRVTGEEVAAAIARANPPQPSDDGERLRSAVADKMSAGNRALERESLHDPVVTFENDVVRGQFATEVAGQTIYLTVAGHLGAKDGYATFDPTEFKIGDLSIPVSLVNPALQKKMAEQRDRMKLPDFISDVRVENGELVVRQK